MATQTQKKAVKILSDSIGRGGEKINMGKIMRVAGYSELTSKTPQRLTESKGFNELCKKAGLTKDLVLKALADDIREKPRDRSKEIGHACKILGLYKADNEQASSLSNVAIPDSDFVEIIRMYKVRH